MINVKVSARNTIKLFEGKLSVTRTRTEQGITTRTMFTVTAVSNQSDEGRQAYRW